MRAHSLRPHTLYIDGKSKDTRDARERARERERQREKDRKIERKKERKRERETREK